MVKCRKDTTVCSFQLLELAVFFAASGPWHVLWLQCSSFPGYQHEILVLIFLIRMGLSVVLTCSLSIHVLYSVQCLFVSFAQIFTVGIFLLMYSRQQIFVSVL